MRLAAMASARDCRVRGDFWRDLLAEGVAYGRSALARPGGTRAAGRSRGDDALETPAAATNAAAAARRRWSLPRLRASRGQAPRQRRPIANCSNPNAIGVSRIVEIDTTGGPGFGFEHFKTHDFLREGEVVLTFDDGPWPKTPRRC